MNYLKIEAVFKLVVLHLLFVFFKSSRSIEGFCLRAEDSNAQKVLKVKIPLWITFGKNVIVFRRTEAQKTNKILT